MFTPLILFLSLTVATAVIAHWSDNLGKKLGKKRVSLFGLRPRTTATVLTIASSWGIMLFTLVALLVAVAPLRNALFSYDRERAQAQHDREQASAQIESGRQRLASTQIQVDAANGQLEKARQKLEHANRDVGNSRAALRQAKRAEKEGFKRAKEAQRGEKTAQQGAKRALQQVVEAQKRVVAARKRFEEAQRREAIARRDENAAQRETGAARRQTESARRSTENAKRELQNSTASLNSVQAQYKTAQSNLKVVRSNVVKAKTLLYGTSHQLLQTEQQLLKTEQQLEVRQQVAEAFAASNAPIKIGQTFAASIIVANQKPDALVEQLRVLLRQGRESFAEEEDASPTPNFPAGTNLQLLPLDAQDASGKVVQLQGDQLLQFLAGAMRRQTTANSISARLIAWRNYLAGENSIGVRFVFVPIKPAFGSGEILASATIDGSQADWRIFRSLSDLLNLGQRRAEALGVNPPFSPDEPYFYASGTNVRIFAALRALEGSKKRLQVNLVTFKALSTVEPLQVRFEIEGGLSDPAATSPTAAPTS